MCICSHAGSQCVSPDVSDPGVPVRTVSTATVSSRSSSHTSNALTYLQQTQSYTPPQTQPKPVQLPQIYTPTQARPQTQPYSPPTPPQTQTKPQTHLSSDSQAPPWQTQLFSEPQRQVQPRVPPQTQPKPQSFLPPQSHAYIPPQPKIPPQTQPKPQCFIPPPTQPQEDQKPEIHEDPEAMTSVSIKERCVLVTSLLHCKSAYITCSMQIPFIVVIHTKYGI